MPSARRRISPADLPALVCAAVLLLRATLFAHPQIPAPIFLLFLLARVSAVPRSRVAVPE